MTPPHTAVQLPQLPHLSIAELEAQLAAQGFKTSHAARLLRAFYHRGSLPDLQQLRLPAALPKWISAHWQPQLLRTLHTARSSDGTTKLLLQTADSRTLESVLMPDYRPDRAAACVSSQVGCAMACDFCATTKTGFERNLTAAEIIEQFLALRREAASQNRRLQTLVFMGMGEPLLNLDHVLEAVRRIGDNRLGGLGWRQITVSTVGIIPGIDALTASGLSVNLAVSLHASNDSVRSELLPTGRRFPIADILAAADRFHAARGRPVTVQYCLLAGVNDHPTHAEELAALLKQRRFHVNLLTYNPTGTSLRGHDYRGSTPEAAARFASILADRGIVAHTRRSRGPDIDAACGQLRRRSMER